jgi:thiol-disulfide isomerase/thioredoxin
MRQYFLMGAAVISLVSFGWKLSLGRADEVVAQKEAAGEKKDGEKTDDAAKKKQAADAEEQKTFYDAVGKEFNEKLTAASEGKEVDFGPFVKRISDRLATKAGVEEVDNAINLARILEIFTSADNVKPIYESIEKLADRIQAKQPELAAKVRRAVKGPMARINMIGTSPVIEGTTVDGEKFDWAKYKGKVVLLDFWATWCGPCVQEIPNVKKAYEKYHDKGFEVVGISRDDSKEDLVAFIEKEKLPWPTIHPSDELAQKFLISSIPATFLIDRDGKLVSVSARGPRLEAQLEKLLGKK